MVFFDDYSVKKKLKIFFLLFFFQNLSLNKPSNMSVVNLKELVENYAYKFFKENEKEYHRKLGKSYGWKEMAREIDWKGLR